MTTKQIKKRLEYLRGEIQAERISYGEIAELQGLAEHIEPGDVELLEWAGVPEFPEEVIVKLDTAELDRLALPGNFLTVEVFPVIDGRPVKIILVRGEREEPEE